MLYDLEQRTKDFSKNVLTFLKSVKRDEINKNLISQVARSATSVGANYHEANGASSKNDFRNKIFICRKEIQETAYWLELIESTNPEKKQDLVSIREETSQLMKIFGKISVTLRG